MENQDKHAELRKSWFGSSAIVFGWMSALLLILLAVAPTKNFFSEWHGYQQRYLKLIGGRGDAAVLRRHFEPGVHQIWNPDLQVVDRCTTCHVALTETTLGEVTEQPFSRHPAMPHKVDQFGCTMCHRGQGPATTVQEAHMSTLAWEEPILPARYMESSCGQCHRGDLQGTPQLNLGRKMLASSGCVHCHTIRRPDGTTFTATDDPPSLSHIADKTTREWIYAWLKDPQAYASTAKMPNFKLSDVEARDISAFLIENSKSAASKAVAVSIETAKKVQQDPTLQQKASSLYGESFCASCHAVQNAAGNVVGGNLGPELTRVGSKVKPEWLQAWIRNPAAYDPGTAMPHYRFNDQEVGMLTGFLLAKADNDLLANVHLDPPTQEQIANGKHLIDEYGCSSCHEISGLRHQENFGPELTRIGSKAVAQLPTAPGVAHTLPDYIAVKLKQPRVFGLSLKMPQFTFTAAQSDALVNALLAQTERAHTMPAALTTPAVMPSNYEPAGKAGQLMNDLRCFSCHAINGRGGDMAPDLSLEGSSVQRAWLLQFFRNPNTLRPALVRRMPKFNLTDSEIATLTDYILTVYQSPKVDQESIPNAGYSVAEVEHGRQLFYSRYGCQSCHIVDTKKDKGYIGPTLTQAGSRLIAAWIYNWLKDPQALRPGTAEPNRHMSDNDAHALTAFVMAQKGGTKQEVAKK